jgi:hypothetical protein
VPGTCSQYLSPGDPCGDNFAPNGGCAQDGRCDFASKRCVANGLFEGAACSPSSAACGLHFANVFLVCVDGTCQTAPGLGDACQPVSGQPNPCTEGSCDPTTRVCTAHCI